MQPRLKLLIALALPLIASLGAVPEPLPEEVEANRKRLAELHRADPKQYDWLRNEGLSFLALPPERRQQILQLDHDLHQEISSKQARLANTLDRYVDWLKQIPEDDRQRITQAPTKEARLGLIRELRYREWLRTQPKALQEQAAKLTGDEKNKFIEDARKSERQRQAEWHLASRFWRELDNKTVLPVRLEDFAMPPYEKFGIPAYVKEYLMPMLSPAEKKRLAAAEGKWPDYPRTLVELADKHPPALPGPFGHKSPGELPKDIVELIQKKKGVFKGPEFTLKGIESSFNRWPAFAVAFTNYCVQKQIPSLPNEFWAFNETCLHKDMKDLLKNQFPKVLTKEEDKRLYQSTNKWPDYPQIIQELADKYQLRAPWFTLPGPRLMWDRYRNPAEIQPYPEISKQKLRDFLTTGLQDLDEKERNRLMNFMDPQVRQELTELFFQRNEQELRRLKLIDSKKKNKKLGQE